MWLAVGEWNEGKVSAYETVMEYDEVGLLQHYTDFKWRKWEICGIILLRFYYDNKKIMEFHNEI